MERGEASAGADALRAAVPSGLRSSSPLLREEGNRPPCQPQEIVFPRAARMALPARATEGSSPQCRPRETESAGPDVPPNSSAASVAPDSSALAAKACRCSSRGLIGSACLLLKGAETEPESMPLPSSVLDPSADLLSLAPALCSLDPRPAADNASLSARRAASAADSSLPAKMRPFIEGRCTEEGASACCVSMSSLVPATAPAGPLPNYRDASSCDPARWAKTRPRASAAASASASAPDIARLVLAASATTASTAL